MLSKIISENDSNATVAIVTHGGMIIQLYRSFLKLPIDSDVFFYTGDKGIHEWHIEKDCHSVVKANYTAHTRGI